ncbi:hypothetical protein DCAR_0522522 [Daucus carota subsp. sativus]|uniref:Uncharacterized protein n=1 Tax=Daucus carota subsp. sativus TaxID=79200 RepID=A0A162A5D0_DAUCS|nr:hypothetical protein DCAR_0522522 [Daucus carota subsp. sativus]
MSKQYRGVKMEKSLLLFILIVTSACVVESYVNETAALYAFDEMPSSVSCDSMRDVPVELRKELRKKMRSSLVALRKKLSCSICSHYRSVKPKTENGKMLNKMNDLDKVDQPPVTELTQR